MNRLVTLVVAVPITASCGLAQQTTAPAVEQLKVKVTAVDGMVQVRGDERQPRPTATVSLAVRETAEARTGPGSAVRFVIPPAQTLPLARLGTVRVLTAINQNGKIKTDLAMKYGRTRYAIEAGAREHESTIASPSSTLAVRGT